MIRRPVLIALLVVVVAASNMSTAAAYRVPRAYGTRAMRTQMRPNARAMSPAAALAAAAVAFRWPRHQHQQPVQPVHQQRAAKSPVLLEQPADQQQQQQPATVINNIHLPPGDSLDLYADEQLEMALASRRAKAAAEQPRHLAPDLTNYEQVEQVPAYMAQRGAALQSPPPPQPDYDDDAHDYDDDGATDYDLAANIERAQPQQYAYAPPQPVALPPAPQYQEPHPSQLPVESQQLEPRGAGISQNHPLARLAQGIYRANAHMHRRPKHG